MVKGIVHQHDQVLVSQAEAPGTQHQLDLDAEKFFRSASNSFIAPECFLIQLTREKK